MLGAYKLDDQQRNYFTCGQFLNKKFSKAVRLKTETSYYEEGSILLLLGEDDDRSSNSKLLKMQMATCNSCF